MNTTILSDTPRPNKTWKLSTLEDYALDRASEINNFGRRTITQTWLFGSSLALIRDIKKGKGEWMTWVKTQHFSLSTATNAIKLHARIGFEDLGACEGITISDLKAALDIIKRPPPRRREVKTVPTSPGHATDQNNEATTRKIAPDNHLKVFSGNRQHEEKTTTRETHLDQPQKSAPQTLHTSSAKSETHTSTTSPIVAMEESLHKINVKLEQLERDLKVVKPDDHLLKLLDQAISTLQRLRAAVADAA